MKNDNFLDSRTLMAILLVGVTFVAWQVYMQKKYPAEFADKPAVTEAGKPLPKTEAPAQPSAGTPIGEAAIVASSPAEADRAVAEKVIPFSSDTLAFELSSKGMGLKNIQIRKYKNRNGEIIKMGQPAGNFLPFETRLIGNAEPLDFQIEQVNPTFFTGHAKLGTLRVQKTVEVIPERYLLHVKVVAEGGGDQFIGLSTAVTEAIAEAADGQMQEFYVDTAETDDRVILDSDNLQKVWSKVKVASVGSQYFTEAIIDSSSIMPEAKGHVVHGEKSFNIILQYPVLNRGGPFALDYRGYIGPKAHGLLSQVDENLARVVDFGYFNWIGRHILELLKAFYGMVGNWGTAIICLTVLVRILVLPINIYSYKSMRAMQTIQPQIQALRERYKDDQQKQQQEMMALMKTNKVNPVGGCLPILLQFPIFVALYQVLGNSIELYQAPFALWIHDLSLKDPFYILPVLMGLTMFVQQKITPNNMDPAQAKVLLMMPLIFTVFMFSLPSGLTLYMLVGALFSVAQQMYFMKQPNIHSHSNSLVAK